MKKPTGRILNQMKKTKSQKNQKQYFLDKDGQFIIENYNQAAEFTNFFPGIAGLFGIPMWVFYANRGQGVTSFGIEAKDKAIMEFQPANKAYRSVSLQGFRTFIKIKSGPKSIFYEPFQNRLTQANFKTEQRMAVTSHDLTIEEINHTLGLHVRVNYFTLPEEPFAALVRRVTLKNISSKKIDLEIIDGMPAIVAFGLNDHLLKYMTRTAEAWARVSNLENKAPYFNLKVVISDKPAVSHITAGNFYFSFCEQGNSVKILDPLVQPSCVFGASSDFMVPENFLKEKTFKVPTEQSADNSTPCAMSFAKINLPAKSEKKLISFIGHSYDKEQLNVIVKKCVSPEYVQKKAARNKTLIDEIKNFMVTSSASKEFDLYCGQTFLDNALRGGLPVSLKTGTEKLTLSVFTRKHGDPERDYNYFILSPTFFSQGNGNYRDVNQNRRNDIWFNPDVDDSHAVNFLNLLQADGYNPLIVRGDAFFVENAKKLDEILKECVSEENIEHVKGFFKKHFLLGSLLASVVQRGIKLKVSPEEFLKRALTCCQKQELAEHGEGFWSDHWTYNLDLLESFLAVYPERRQNLLLEKNIFSFYHDAFYVLPRDERYILTSRGCRQYHSVADGRNEIKSGKRDNKLRTQNGQGPVYYTNLVVKLLSVAANKVSSLDPSGIGVEMEADKPNWYDALNGLPGLLGSSISETFELKRLCLFLLESFEKASLPGDQKIKVFIELHNFILNLKDCLASWPDALSFWNRSNEIKEYYRSSIKHGVSGEEKELTVSQITDFLKFIVAKADAAAKLAKNAQGLYVTYFAHEVTRFEKLNKINGDGDSHIRPLDFKRHDLPLFLEGFVHALRVEKNQGEARKLYKGLLKSPVFDKKLKMYKVNSDLSKETEEIGRATVFPAGWLENESVWSHMEYKFLLELLRGGLYEEFYANFKNCLVPFLNPAVYGRSILENSSFIVSSAHKDARLHGRGFVARLSGTTAEFLHMWLWMNVGQNPFSLDGEGRLLLRFCPVLPGWLFTKHETTINFLSKNNSWKEVKLPKNTYSFNFLGTTLVVYHNSRCRDTFGKNAAQVEKILLTYPGKPPIPIESKIIPSPYAADIRDRKLEQIDIILK